MWASDSAAKKLLVRAGIDARLLSNAALASVLFAAAIGAFLIARRVTGAVHEPLAAAQLVMTAVVLCVWVFCVHQLAAGRPVVLGAARVALILFVVGCSYPGGRLLDWVVWLPGLGFVAWLPFAKKWGASPVADCGRQSKPELVALDDAAETRVENEHVVQQLTRVRTAAGQDVLRGKLSAEFANGERQVTLFVGFCPPFETLPRVEAGVANEWEAEIKLSQVLHNGTQLDVRLSEPAEEPIEIMIEFAACDTGGNFKPLRHPEGGFATEGSFLK